MGGLDPAQRTAHLQLVSPQILLLQVVEYFKVLPAISKLVQLIVRQSRNVTEYCILHGFRSITTGQLACLDHTQTDIVIASLV